MKGQIFILASFFIISLVLSIPLLDVEYMRYSPPFPCLEQPFLEKPSMLAKANSTHVQLFGTGWAEVNGAWAYVSSNASFPASFPATVFFHEAFVLEENSSRVICPGKDIYMAPNN